MKNKIKTPKAVYKKIFSINRRIDSIINKTNESLTDGLVITATAFSPEGLYKYSNNGKHVTLSLIVNLEIAPEEFHEEYQRAVEDTISYRDGKEVHSIRNHYIGKGSLR